ncbi:MAG: protein-L-isoaspartate(D-aspartate) O-methyltransferase [Candidatus Syntrophosphaera sp.]|nr:protein-L-isoaspartate(D-aspartate) O-methyltransferase [Candidatus Syntrophosphaera sp.]
MRFEDQRALLVQELTRTGITDERVLAAFARVPRELYVLPQYRDYAYRNQPLPIDLDQTISQPLMIAIMLQYLELKEEDVVLEIGTGSGYQSALLAELARDVCTIERLEPLSLKAQSVLRDEGYRNIHFRIGDGAQGWQKAFPPYKEFNKIVVSAAAIGIPQRLKEQLAEGGIMVVPVGKGRYQDLNRVVRQNNEYIVTEHGGCTFVPLISS